MFNEEEKLHIFTKELHERLETSGLTYRELAFRARCAPSRVQMYLRGSNFPNLWTLALISEALDCTMDDLLGCCSKNNSRIIHADSPFKRFTDEFDFALHFKECLSAKMNCLNMTQEALAGLTGFGKHRIYRYLSLGYPMPHLAQTLIICDALDCTPSDLLGY